MNARVARGGLTMGMAERTIRGQEGIPSLDFIQEIDFRQLYMGTGYVVEEPSILHKQGKMRDLLILYFPLNSTRVYRVWCLNCYPSGIPFS